MNFQKKLDDFIDNLKSGDVPRLLLHSCCAPCSSYVLAYLMEYFDITVLYYNPNIYPESEFEKRMAEQRKLIDILNSKSDISYVIDESEHKKKRVRDIKLITPDYDHEEFLNIAFPYKDEKEGGKRCEECFRLRLKKTKAYAASNGFELFGTTLSVSPHKDAVLINKIGRGLQDDVNLSFLVSDFKKKEGFKISTILSKDLDLYRQDYCGCEFSL